jgi:hypothetical protein
MADKTITQLDAITAVSESHELAIWNGTTTKKITRSNFMRNVTIAAGGISGAVDVDLGIGHHFTFTLNGDVDVTLINPLDGERYVFIVTNGGNHNVNSIVVTGGVVYLENGNLPNVTSNKTDIFEAFCVGSDIYLYSIKRFETV